MDAKNERPAQSQKEQIAVKGATMTSREIAEVAGKIHKNVLQSIRNMEPAWEKVTGLKFQPSEYEDSSGRKVPMFELTKRETLYIATKFNDEARARLIIRWEELEHQNLQSKQRQLAEMASDYQENTVTTIRMGTAVNQIYITGGIVYAKFSTIMRHLGYANGGSTQYINRIGREHFIQIEYGNQQVWFIDEEGFNELLKMSMLSISSSTVRDIYRMFRLENNEKLQEYPYQFTNEEMLNIVNALFMVPVNKKQVHRLLLNGKREGDVL